MHAMDSISVWSEASRLSKKWTPALTVMKSNQGAEPQNDHKGAKIESDGLEFGKD